MTEKYVGENISLPDNKYVQIMAHGGFWKVNKIAFKLLEGLLTLHVFLRSFSHTTDQQQDSNVKAF